ncbi:MULTISPECIES: hypothetical protein [Acinetobacter]|uniref:hypothetical protein n=1 Tax=Acinetobacter TaxID=469 RepID=UPI0018A2F65F|nr:MULTISPECIES: hypothetical protein [Acinetobacter]MBF7691570.1 hypothetical protein [Acinetobacter pollinis]MBF7699248.1 hypothetical protein [Acinetobacter pollinis]MCF9035304.1 hypothetical protein [Acinetobacter nectaris]
MNTVKQTRIHRIPAQKGVDPIDVFIDWYGDDQSQVTIRCWDSAWTSYWGAHGHQDIENYLAEVHNCSLVNRFARTQSSRELKWLKGICESIQFFFQENDFGKKEEKECVA